MANVCMYVNFECNPDRQILISNFVYINEDILAITLQRLAFKCCVGIMREGTLLEPVLQ